MAETARERADRWAALPDGTVIDALSEMAQLTAEIICRAIFGRELGADDARDIVHGFSEFQRAVSRIDLFSLLGFPDWMPRARRFLVYRSVRRIHRVIDDIVAGHRERANAKTVSLVGRLMDARDPDNGERFDPLAIRNEAVVIFMAGHETTASTLAFAWFLISQAPDVEARLHDEIDGVLGDRPPALADVPKLVYTRAIIEETLRPLPADPDPCAVKRYARRRSLADGYQRLAHSRCAVAAASESQAMGQTGRLSARAISRRKRAGARQVELHPIQHRAASLRWHGVRPNRGYPLCRHLGAGIQLAAGKRPRNAPGMPSVATPWRRAADDTASKRQARDGSAAFRAGSYRAGSLPP